MLSSVWWSPIAILLFITFTSTQSTTLNIPQTAGSGCSANYAFIYVESSLGSIAKTITSERVNYAPYTYSETVPRRKLVPFAADEPITDLTNNPCDSSTWSAPPSYYNDAIVFMEYDITYSMLCTPQKWTLNFQTYANVSGLLIANNADLTNVYPLHGDSSLAAPTLPTRMISQSSAANIRQVLNATSAEEVYVSIGCFDIESPPLICVVDESALGGNVELDGDFQKQSHFMVNDHPVWLKEGMNGVWGDYYIWLSVDSSLLVNAWRWVIGTNVYDESTITAECRLNTPQYIDDPTKCGHNWYRDGVKITNLTSNDGICDLGDSHVCVNSGIETFDFNFGGRYRQVHDGTALWVADNPRFDAYISVRYINRTWASGWSFVFTWGANGGEFAFCPISDTRPTAEQTLKPWDCNKNWYVVGVDENGGYRWFNDPLMDVDECSHPDAPNPTVATEITYPDTLCLMDPTYKYSHYQSYYGVYALDESLVSSGRYVYRNQRLKLNHDEWYMIWYEQKDAWIINDFHVWVPDATPTFGGICRDNVNTPDQCTACWEFFEGVDDELNCEAAVRIMSTEVESDCMRQPVNTIASYADDITLCFDDGRTDVLQSAYTGKWKLETRGSYNDRAYWYLADTVTGHAQYYMYYDATWRYWVINPIFSLDEEHFELYCLHWDEFEPFNCDTWYTSEGERVSMGTQCTLQPTAAPTPHPTAQCVEYNKYVYAESPGFTHQVLQSSEVNFPTYASQTFYHVRLVPFEELTMNTGNPCNSSTWSEDPAFYDDRVVMIKLSTFYESLCTAQEWTLQLENYANVRGVIVANYQDLTHVYALSGDDSLSAPTIPTRMVSQMAGHILEYALQRQDPVYISFGCHDDTMTYPSTICLVDTTIVGEHVYLDGEYQRQTVEVNDHPVWLKQGHTGLWSNIYMFLDIDRSVSGRPSWRWVIGTDYNDRGSIISECNLNGRHIAHPALCDHDWSINGTLASNITTKGTQCALGDNYICVDSAEGGFFESYFEGRYRQVHEGVALWLLEDEYLDAHVRIARLSWPEIFGPDPKYVFAFMVNQTTIYAFCVIGDNYPTWDDALSPWQCNEDWYVVSWTHSTGYEWVIDLAFDVDECTHPNLTTTPPQYVQYPETLCLSDHTNTPSHYQSRYGVYVLDSDTRYDGRYVYRNQRLADTHDEWYILWYEEKDAWVINEMVPGVTVVRDTDGICRDDVATPDLCTACWQFADIHGVFGTDCNVKAKVTTSTLESDCMQLPQNNVIHYTNKISLCFDDGLTADWDNIYTGDWILEPTHTYNDRAYWYKLDDTSGDIQYYMFYDDVWRYWIMDRVLGRNENTTSWSYLHWYCLAWDEFEPFTCDTWYSASPNVDETLSMKRDCVSPAPTAKPTLSPTVSCDARETWIYAESEQYVLIAETLISQYTNFAPYVYDTFAADLVLFEGGRTMTNISSNPCDYHTWSEYPSYYEGNVILIHFSSDIASLCSVEQWTLNLQLYGDAKAVIVANNKDWYHVYALAGDDAIQNPHIPTRMISEFAGNSLNELLDQDENVVMTFGCWDDDLAYPPIICLVDTSLMGTHVYLDGEYQRQSTIQVNEHPVWLKTGFEGLWKAVYMFLDVDPNAEGDSSWRWVIGTDYNDATSVIAECRMPGYLHGKHLDHPALCDGNWYINGTEASNVVTSDTTCALGDNYICVTSQSGRMFDYYFDGQYRQIHDGVPLWLLEDKILDAYITVGQVSLPELFGDDEMYVFAFIVNQTEVYAFCPIGSGMAPTHEASLSPWTCNEDWYKIDYDANGARHWVIDYEFDIDECVHPQLTTAPPKYVSYPETLCLNDPTNAYTRYQSHYGVYLLDTSRTYDDKYVYYNQRLAGNHDEWFMIWYDEKDAWVINEMIPETTVVHDTDGMCPDDVFTPDLCSTCWEFADSNGVFESNCNVKVHKMSTKDETDCMTLHPVNDRTFFEDYTQQITLGFGNDADAMHKNAFTGVWRLEINHQYLDRPYWYKASTTQQTAIDYYMFYDPTWKYWVIDRVLGNTVSNEWHLYCLRWDEFEPFQCDTWYSSAGLTVQMDTSYTMPPPTTTATDVSDRDMQAGNSRLNLLPWIGWTFGFVAIVASLFCMVCFYRKRKEKRYMFEDVSQDGAFKTIYGVTRNDDEDDDIDIIQMERVTYNGGTLGSATGKGTRGKGEIVAVQDSDSDDEHISHHIIDDGEGLVTGDDEKPLNESRKAVHKPRNWVKFEE